MGRWGRTTEAHEMCAWCGRDTRFILCGNCHALSVTYEQLLIRVGYLVAAFGVRNGKPL